MKRKTPMKRGGRIKPKKRSAEEYRRVYGSKERVEWVKAQPCVVCIAIHPVFGLVDGTSHNAHTENGGRGRKAGYETISPLCPSHHSRYDEHRFPCDDPKVRQYIKDCAALTEKAWQEHCRRSA